ncbi:uracil-DNA glycosylase [Sphingomonas sp. C3-2]|nr:uracil-DNA glycosylase [Sphingomonas sp. C3-2]WOK38242.1 uracil-DNA glycosylase [Sphingomonas sp. C3-2]
MIEENPLNAVQPAPDCTLCPRLAAYREEQRIAQPKWWNAPVPAFGDPEAWLTIVGLAPGLHGANRTGRAFTGDEAGRLLFATLAKFGFVDGEYGADPMDAIRLNGVMLLNAVKCVPPHNKPMPEEIRTCRTFLRAEREALPKARVFLALGQIAHQSTVKMLGGKLPKLRFEHGAVHRLPRGEWLIDSYHCSRLNTGTGRLTAEMFEAVFEQAMALRPC